MGEERDLTTAPPQRGRWPRGAELSTPVLGEEGKLVPALCPVPTGASLLLRLSYSHFLFHDTGNKYTRGSMCITPHLTCIFRAASWLGTLVHTQEPAHLPGRRGWLSRGHRALPQQTAGCSVEHTGVPGPGAQGAQPRPSLTPTPACMARTGSTQLLLPGPLQAFSRSLRGLVGRRHFCH